MKSEIFANNNDHREKILIEGENLPYVSCKLVITKRINGRKVTHKINQISSY